MIFEKESSGRIEYKYTLKIHGLLKFYRHDFEKKGKVLQLLGKVV